jgi:hypothetical protein
MSCVNQSYAVQVDDRPEAHEQVMLRAAQMVQTADHVVDRKEFEEVAFPSHIYEVWSVGPTIKDAVVVEQAFTFGVQDEDQHVSDEHRVHHDRVVP